MPLAVPRVADDVDGQNAVRRARWARAIAAVAPSAVLIARAGTLAPSLEIVLVLLASACALDLVRVEARDPGNPVPIACAIAALFAIAVIYPPRFSHDLWSYAMVGRIVVVHHASPYLNGPAAFPHDPFLALVGRGWRSVPTPYGPLFTFQASVTAIVAGSHPLLYRLAYQVAAAAFVGVALCVLWRTSRSTSALALLGLHPVIACSVINGGHNDAFVGLGLLLAAIAARRERYTHAGWWIAAAVLVKVTAGLALLPLMGWAWARGRWHAVGRLAAAPLLVGVPVMLATPGVLRALSRSQIGVITRASIWNVPLRLVPRLLPGAPRATGAMLGSFALVVVVIVVVCVVRADRRVFDPAPGVVAAIAAWLIFGGYVLPWYTVWALPAAALLGHHRVKWVVAMQGVAVTAVFLIPRSSLSSSGALSDIVRFGVPTALAAMFIWAILQRPRGRFACR